jgi:hypothetical protein
MYKNTMMMRKLGNTDGLSTIVHLPKEEMHESLLVDDDDDFDLDALPKSNHAIDD